ncbi:MAG: HEAT repeat domain-containing protein, partial [Planctomycetes bacterium]|nr:HEAT repeat domain-containing protein [Planctomycetota bacterium]
MFAPLTARLCWALVAWSSFCSPCATDSFATPTAAATVRGDEQPFKALRAWLKLYEKGKIDYRSRENIGKHSIAAKFDIRDKLGLGFPTWSGDLVAILDALAKIDDAEAARAIAEVAAIGLDDEEYTYAMAPYEVRRVGLEALAQLKSDAAKEELAAGARGDWKSRKHGDALRAAALLALGHIGDDKYRPVLVAGLADGDEIVRLHAIDALARLGGEDAAMALIGVVEGETNPTVLVSAAKALRTIYSGYLQRVAEADRAEQEAEAKKGVLSNEEKDAKPDAGAAEDAAAKKNKAARPDAPKSARLAVRAAIKALGRTNWRADMVLIRLLDDFRTSESVPALIAVLERFRDNPDDIKSGKLSGLLKYQVHELLVSMTGAVFSAEQPDKWRVLWEREKDNLQVATKHQGAGGTPKTSASGFAGIPVEGTRVVFVLDLSGSMQAPIDIGGGTEAMRIDYAKRELLAAVDGLSEDAFFNLVTFNGNPEAEQWSKKLVSASKRNVGRFHKYVEKLRPNGGTNLWGGIAKGLSIKSLVFGNHYETTVDEVFILSDGAPTAGEVIDPVEILRLVQEANRYQDVRINTVFISSPL